MVNVSKTAVCMLPCILERFDFGACYSSGKHEQILFFAGASTMETQSTSPVGCHLCTIMFSSVQKNIYFWF